VGLEGVGGAVSGLIRVWKSVEKYCGDQESVLRMKEAGEKQSHPYKN